MGCAATRIFFWLTIGLFVFPMPVNAVTGDFDRNEALCRDPDAITDQRIDACGWLIDSVGQTGAVSPDIYFNRGSARIDKGEYRRALDDFNSVILHSPRYVDAYVGRGIAWRELSEYERAHAEIAKALDLDSKNSRSYSHRGITYYLEGNTDLALQDFDEAIRLDPDDPFAYNWRGVAYRDKKALELAIEDLDQAIELSPYYYWAHFNRGLVNYDRQEFQRMVWDYDEVIRIEPEDYNGFFNRAVAHVKLENWTHAIEDFSEAIRLNPDDAETYRRRAAIYRVIGKFDLAILDYQMSDRFVQTIEESSAFDPDFAFVYRLRGEMRIEARDYRGAIADFDTAIRLAPLEREHYPLLEAALEKAINGIVRTSDDFVLKGRAYAQRKNYKRAVQELEMALSHDPDNVMARFHLSRAHGQLGDYREASKFLDKHYGELFDKGRRYIEAGELEKAQKILASLLILFPTEGYAYEQFGRLYLRSGKLAKGIEAFKKAGRAYLDDSWMLGQLGRAYFYAGDFELASSTLEMALEADPEDLYNHLWMHLARVRGLRESDLSKTMGGRDLTEWPGPVVQYFMGQINERVFLDLAASGPDAGRRTEKQCEAAFFVGEQHLIADRKREAASSFRSAQEICPREFVEYLGAIVELSSLGAN